MTCCTTVYEYLKATRAHPDEASKTSTSGVYALFGNDEDCLPRIALPSDGLVYIGQSDNLHRRNHFTTRLSSSSTLRRSLGAILKVQLELIALPPITYRIDRDFRHFRFSRDGEERLKAWMQKNLSYAVLAISGDTGCLERQLIKSYEPPLNLMHWDNPQRKLLRNLRAACRVEALKNR